MTDVKAAYVLPYHFAKQQHVLFIGHEVAFTERTMLSALLEIQRQAGVNIALKQISVDEFEKQLAQLYSEQARSTQQLLETAEESVDLQTLVDNLPTSEDLLDDHDNAPIIRLINALLSEAIKQAASDLHIETYDKQLIIRLRVDGVLRTLLKPERKLAAFIVSRLKVMAQLDIAEKRLPQDGRMALRIAGRDVDVRVSTIPTHYGERVVLRILDKTQHLSQLNQLGLDAKLQTQLEALLQLPHGIILVTGPTGSGKSTSLYAMLNYLNHSSRNILTVEDPVEYNIAGIGQIQVNNKINMTFARGLRSILRQDPDIVMVGEIRDSETAEIAVQASLTGHLVLSTLHTNTAIGALTRLQDLGVERFLLSSSVVGLIAQRLVRRLCVHCKQGSTPQGCEHCHYSGYHGRIALYECISIDAHLRQLIADGASEKDCIAYIRQHNPSIQENGRKLVAQGKTSEAEILRVTGEVLA